VTVYLDNGYLGYRDGIFGSINVPASYSLLAEGEITNVETEE
jgi:hypothetical protein